MTTGCSSSSTTADSNPLELEKTNRYELMIGLNDATTGKQILSTEKATALVKEKILNYVDGVTITTSQGSYYIGALVVNETSLNCVIYGSDDDSIATLIEEINAELNVAVLVAKTTSDYHLIIPNQSI
jgi:hypothetical protein